MLNDLRYAIRGFRQHLAFTLTALFAIALGIGATTAVFSVVDRILFRSLPYPSDDRLVSLGVFAPIAPHEFLFLDLTLPVTIETMKQRVSKLADRPRFNAVLLGMFAGMGVLLGCGIGAVADGCAAGCLDSLVACGTC